MTAVVVSGNDRPAFRVDPGTIRCGDAAHVLLKVARRDDR
jgi:hypothetical protein